MNMIIFLFIIVLVLKIKGIVTYIHRCCLVIFSMPFSDIQMG